MNHQVAWAMLEEYLDGALAASARWEVTAHLDECAVCRKHVAHQARLRGAVRDHLAAIEPPSGLPRRLRAALAAETGRPWSPVVISWQTPSALRFVALLGPALVALWLLAWVTAPVAGSPSELHGELAAMHALFAQDESMLDVTGDGERIATWFREEVGLTVTTPELAGYELLGGRLIALDGKATAQIVYESERDETYLSLIRFADSGARRIGNPDPGGMITGQQGTMTFVVWPVGQERAALVAEAPEAELRRLAEELVEEHNVADGDAS